MDTIIEYNKVNGELLAKVDERLLGLWSNVTAQYLFIQTFTQGIQVKPWAVKVIHKVLKLSAKHVYNQIAGNDQT